MNGKDQRGFGRSATRCAIGSFEPQVATYTVGSASDPAGMETLTGCQNGANPTCSLRDAITYAASGSDTIVFNSTGRGTITLTNDAQHGTLTLAASVTITGPTSGSAVIVDGNNAVAVFTVNSGVTASLSNLTIQHGSGNSGSGNNGGGIYNFGTLTVTNSTMTGNSATNGGGGIASSGTLTVTNSTLTGNSAEGGDGGGISNNGTVTVTNSTLSGNIATNGGGIVNTGTVTVRNTIVAGNTAPTNADIAPYGVTIIRSMIGGNPLLAPLANNGGPTQTRLPLPGSPVIGDGDPAICNQTGVGNVNGRDQRGFARPTSLCALGAAEPVLSQISPTAGYPAGGEMATLTGSGYVVGTSVSIGGVSCANVQVVSSTTLTCTVGAHGVGTVDVVVTEGSLTGTLPGGYTYTYPSAPGPAPRTTVVPGGHHRARCP